MKFLHHPLKNYETIKTMIRSIDDSWSSDFLDTIDSGPKNNKVFEDISVVSDKFTKFGWAVSLKNKNAKSRTDAFPQIVKTSKRKPHLLETDVG